MHSLILKNSPSALSAEKLQRRAKSLSINHPDPHARSFVHDDIAKAYEECIALIKKHSLFHVVQVIHHEAYTSIVMYNLWRIDNRKDGSLRTYVFCLQSAAWKPSKDASDFPVMGLAPAFLVKQHLRWREHVSAVIRRVVAAVGVILRTGLINALESDYIKQGRLKPNSMRGGVAVLRKCIHKYVVHRDVISAILAVRWGAIYLEDYLHFARHRDGLLKVSRERRNLLPLLTLIDPKWWSHDDCFSRDFWVKANGVAPFASKSNFQKPIVRQFSSERLLFQLGFNDQATFRWFGSAPLMLVRFWAQRHPNNITAIEAMARANYSQPIPVIALQHWVSFSESLSHQGLNDQVRLRLFRVFANECSDLWKDKGFVQVKLWLRSRDVDLRGVIDWLAAEGVAQGHPMRNSTLASLLRRSDDWHRRVAIENLENAANHRRKSWSSPIGKTTIDGVTFKPLCTSKALAVEGYELDHCLGSYDFDCASGNYLAFAATDTESMRSTIGFVRSQDGSSNWSIDQHEAKFRALPPQAHILAARKLLEQIVAKSNLLIN